VIVGVLVGGRSRRMHGRPKGLLLAPREPDGSRATLIERTIALARERGEVVLVGSAEAYAATGVRAIDDHDTARGEGPLAGLAGLLDYARGASVIALACDMPYLTGAMLATLASYAPDAAAVAPREDGKWSPLFARYDSRRTASVAVALLASGARAAHAVLDACDTRELPLSSVERAALRDWDRPEDIDDEGLA
jgi:molybdopterin-guanine dinucleotide biosynthesis protein A